MLKQTLALVGLIISTTTNAALIDNGTFTTDTSTGWDWLDLSYTLSYSYNELIAATNSGGLFEEYTLASHTQVNTLYSAVGLPSAGNYTTNFAAVNNLISFVGATSSQGSYLQAVGITSTPSGDLYKVAGMDFLFNGGTPTYSLINDLSYGTGFGPDSVAGWLVKPSAVPIPAAAWLFGSALIGLAGIKRKK